MDRAPNVSSFPVGAVVAGAGALAALIGVFLSWATLRTSLSAEAFGGQPFPTSANSVSAAGTSHWTGMLALVASVVALAAAVGIAVLADPATRRMAALAAGGAGVSVVLLAVLGIVFAEGIAVGYVQGGRQALEIARQFAAQLGVEGLTIEAGPAPGVFVSATGGAAAAVGAFLAIRSAGEGSAAPAPGSGLDGR